MGKKEQYEETKHNERKCQGEIKESRIKKWRNAKKEITPRKKH